VTRRRDTRSAPALEPALRVRSFAMRAVEGDAGERLVEGLAVPYGQTIRYDDWWEGTRYERFEAGSVEVEQDGTVHLFYGHDHIDLRTPIGLVIESEDTPDGWRIVARISETAKGDEVYTLLRDGVLNKFSIGFEPLEHRVENEGTDDSTIVRTRVLAREVSVVPMPAYSTADVTGVRHSPRKDTHTMDPDEMRAAIESALEGRMGDLTENLTELERRLTVIADGGTGRQAAPIGAQLRSYGEYVRAIANPNHEHHDAAIELHRAWTGGVLADNDVTTPWVGDLIKLVEKPRKLVNFFAKGADPGKNTYEYGVLESDTTEVAEQELEGDVLAYGKVAISAEPGKMRTYGGWTSMSRQEIERGDIGVVEFAFRALARKYGMTTEAATRVTLAAAPAHTIAGASIATVAGVIDYVADAAIYMDDNGFSLDGWIMSGDVFKTVAKLQLGADGPFLLDRKSGTANIPGLSGDVFNIPFTVIGGAGVNVLADSEAIRTRESAGAPARLTDGDITNLTNAYSVYGYFGADVEIPGALVKPGA